MELVRDPTKVPKKMYFKFNTPKKTIRPFDVRNDEDMKTYRRLTQELKNVSVALSNQIREKDRLTGTLLYVSNTDGNVLSQEAEAKVKTEITTRIAALQLKYPWLAIKSEDWESMVDMMRKLNTTYKDLDAKGKLEMVKGKIRPIAVKSLEDEHLNPTDEDVLDARIELIIRLIGNLIDGSNTEGSSALIKRPVEEDPTEYTFEEVKNLPNSEWPTWLNTPEHRLNIGLPNPPQRRIKWTDENNLFDEGVIVIRGRKPILVEVDIDLNSNLISFVNTDTGKTISVQFTKGLYAILNESKEHADFLYSHRIITKSDFRTADSIANRLISNETVPAEDLRNIPTNTTLEIDQQDESDEEESEDEQEQKEQQKPIKRKKEEEEEEEEEEAAVLPGYELVDDFSKLIRKGAAPRYTIKWYTRPKNEKKIFRGSISQPHDNGYGGTVMVVIDSEKGTIEFTNGSNNKHLMTIPYSDDILYLLAEYRKSILNDMPISDEAVKQFARMLRVSNEHKILGSFNTEKRKWILERLRKINDNEAKALHDMLTTGAFYSYLQNPDDMPEPPPKKSTNSKKSSAPKTTSTSSSASNPDKGTKSTKKSSAPNPAPNYAKPTASSSASSSASKTKTNTKKGRGIIAYKKPADLADRLYVLIGQMAAGNDGKNIKNDIATIADELRDIKAISAKTYKAIYKKINFP